jgi:acyl-CoA thioesterase YciA
MSSVPDRTHLLKPPRDDPDVRVLMLPRDTNGEGSIFGGVILSYIDQAAFVEARRQAHHRYVTVAMKEVVFKEPVYVGDVLSLYAQAIRLGRSSITVEVKVLAERFAPPRRSAHVTEAEVVMVAVDDNRQTCEIVIDDSP